MPIVSYLDDAGEVRWHAKARNHKTTADSAEGYERAFGAREGIRATLEAILETRNEDLVGTPLERLDLENLVRASISNYLDRQSTLLRAEVLIEWPEVREAIESGVKAILIDHDEFKAMADVIADQPRRGPHEPATTTDTGADG